MADEQQPWTLGPLYATPNPNDSILLYDGRVKIKTTEEKTYGPGSEEVEGMAVIRYEWLPYPEVTVHLPGHRRGFTLGDARVTLLDRPWSADAFVHQCGSEGVRAVVPEIMGPLCDRDVERVRRVVFHLPNFAVDFSQSQVFEFPHATSEYRWRVTIQRLPNIRDALESLHKTAGGYLITHVGVIERSDGGDFRLSALEDVRTGLFQFFSFALGVFTAPVLLVGFGEFGQRVWERWDTWKIKPLGKPDSWVPRFKGTLPEAMAGMWQLMQTANGKQAVNNAVHWYVESVSNSGGSEGALILGQAALELLAWLHLVERKRSIKYDPFDNLDSPDRIRLLLADCQIPVDIPEQLTELRATAKRMKWEDGIACITKFRNRAVHPQKQLDGSTPGVEDAHSLCLNWIELALLWLCGYQGAYHDRCRSLAAIDAHWVPWSSRIPAADAEAAGTATPPIRSDPSV